MMLQGSVGKSGGYWFMCGTFWLTTKSATRPKATATEWLWAAGRSPRGFGYSSRQRDCVAMARSLTRVILNEVKNLDLSISSKNEILRLRLRMTLRHSLKARKKAKFGPSPEGGFGPQGG